MINFYDTSSLLLLQEKAFESPFIISSLSVQELEHIKTSKNKTEDVRFSARNLVRLLKTHDDYKVIVYTTEFDDILKEKNLPITNDNLIAATAYIENKNTDIEFFTDDLILSLVAKNVFGLTVQRAKIDKTDLYKGYIEVTLSDDEMALLYENLNVNTYGLLTNEYLVVKNSADENVDLLKWSGETLSTVPKYNLKTITFGDKIKPKDVYQLMAVDSIMSNTVTAISGKAGSGKSLLSLVASMRLIENGKYDRLVIMFNPTSAKGASKMGFYAGDMIDKAMQSSIGNMLITKLGEKYAVETLLNQGKLKLVSMADSRGMEVRDNEILYISECQNASSDLLKLSLTRSADGSKVILDGDYTSQVDDPSFEGDNNGMRRAIDVFRGEDLFGCVELKNVWRSRLAEIADRM